VLFEELPPQLKRNVNARGGGAGKKTRRGGERIWKRVSFVAVLTRWLISKKRKEEWGGGVLKHSEETTKVTQVQEGKGKGGEGTGFQFEGSRRGLQGYGEIRRRGEIENGIGILTQKKGKMEDKMSSYESLLRRKWG